MNIVKLGFLVIGLVSSMWSDTLKVGILPTLDSKKIISMNQPLKQFLEAELKQNVELYTSNGFKNFFEDSKNGQFDILITAPHFGALHLQDGFTPVLRYSAPLKPIFVIHKESKIKTIKDLKNKRIALSSELSASSIGGLKVLLDAKLQNNIDYKLVVRSSHLNAIMSVLLGEADVAITTYTPVSQITDEAIKSKIKYLESDFNMPHIFTMTHPRVSKKQVASLKAALLKFEKTSTGEQFFKDTSFQGYSEISKKDIKTIQPILKETKSFLGLK